MIRSMSGSVLDAHAEALVNTVNCVGVMGKGLALAFKHAHPDNYLAYRRACAQGQIVVGRMFVHQCDGGRGAGGGAAGRALIVNFPTKRHWRTPSELADIADGLIALVDLCRRERFSSIAIPPLGCGNGGLSWPVVRPMITAAFAKLPELDVQLFESHVPERARAVGGGSPIAR